jgi:hypothetical protein
MTPNVQLLRLFTAVLSALASCCFVTYYTLLSLKRLAVDNPHKGLTPALVMLQHYGVWSYGLPILMLVLGIWLLRTRPNAVVRVELVIGMTWLFSCTWAALCLLVFQGQSIPL